MTGGSGFLDAWSLAGAALVVVSMASSAAFIKLLQPLLARYAVARPNARSSHKVPTPQGAGIVIIATTAITAAFAIYFFPSTSGDINRLAWILSATILLTIVGALDDLLALDVLPRIVLQAVAVAIVVAALPPDLRIVSIFPWWLERALLLTGGLWFVNVVNFMDGIDWMTVAEVVPITAGLTIFGLAGVLPQDAAFVATALCGAMIGFAPFNRPVARLFLGDVGSLPIGLILSWLLILFAGNGHLAAALLLPLYYLADATITLLRRLVNGENITQAHRTHFYQRAMDAGYSVDQIVASVFIINFVLFGLAAITLSADSILVQIIVILLGIAMVGALLLRFNGGPPLVRKK